jgi:L-alanine-DL-glutamate epimerase-like enolase superfamily enzyme
MRSLRVRIERWPISGRFSIARGSKTEAEVVVAEVSAGSVSGRGECVPYPRYGETAASVVETIEGIRTEVEANCSRRQLGSSIRSPAARNALDCALWDLEAKLSGQPVWHLAGLGEPRPLVTAFTISLDTPQNMAKAAARSSNRPLLKLKLGSEGDGERLRAIRRAAPRCRLIVDANEGWNESNIENMLAACKAAAVELVEQPLPALADGCLAAIPRHIPVCADESAHDLEGLDGLIGKYDAINIKLDKAGGLTPALDLAEAARNRGLTLMSGCMVATSLSMAPAFLLAQSAAFVDLDGPLLLARDREHAIRYEGSMMFPPSADLWG